jgi:hypothetical protein|tara:strand:+ start:165 stop:743 length:579 start_codon:yes stop_codon:yes gene_type:complete
MKKILILCLSFFLFNSCAQVVATNSTINDFVMMGVKTNSKANVNYTFKSDLADDHFVLMGSLKATTNANITFKGMLDEYMSSKFLNLSGQDYAIEITLMECDISQKMDTGAGNMLMAMSSYGGEASVISKTKVSVTIKGNGVDEVKIISSSAEENYNTVDNVGMNRIYGNVMNKSYNKVLAVLNGFFESLDI